MQFLGRVPLSFTNDVSNNRPVSLTFIQWSWLEGRGPGSLTSVMQAAIGLLIVCNACLLLHRWSGVKEMNHYVNLPRFHTYTHTHTHASMLTQTHLVKKQCTHTHGNTFALHRELLTDTHTHTHITHTHPNTHTFTQTNSPRLMAGYSVQ